MHGLTVDYLADDTIATVKAATMSVGTVQAIEVVTTSTHAPETTTATIGGNPFGQLNIQRGAKA